MNPYMYGAKDLSNGRWVMNVIGKTRAEAFGKLYEIKLGDKDIVFMHDIIDSHSILALPEYKSASNMGEPRLDDLWRFMIENKLVDSEPFIVEQIYPKPSPNFIPGPYVISNSRLYRLNKKGKNTSPSTSVFWQLLFNQYAVVKKEQK